MYPYSISFAGAGRVGSTLCREMYNAGCRIDLIVSETPVSGIPLADSCEAAWSSDLVYPASTDIIIVSVPDHRLIRVLEAIRCKTDTLVVHTAGSFGLDIFPEHIKRKGILYPLQTFSFGRQIDFREVPFLLETSDDDTAAILKNLVDSIGSKWHFTDAEQRRLLHVAAVFVCNFTNHMLTEGKEIAGRAGFSFELLKPLIDETVSKALSVGPENSQTGPAVRNDKNTIETHLELLSFSPELRSLYNEVTKSIIKYYS